MAAWTSDDVYSDYQDTDGIAGDLALGSGSMNAMAGASLNGVHTVEQSGQHVALLALIAVGVLVVLNRLGIQAAVTVK